jgi:hypothetical protein
MQSNFYLNLGIQLVHSHTIYHPALALASVYQHFQVSTALFLFELMIFPIQPPCLTHVPAPCTKFLRREYLILSSTAREAYNG